MSNPSDFLPETVAFVTGASSGIGLSVAERLVQDGIRMITIIDNNIDGLHDAVARLQSLRESAKILSLVVDCTVEAEIEEAIQKTVQNFGRLDFCFNAAGRSGKSAKIEHLESEDLDAVLDLNLKGVWHCERAQIRQMMKQELRDLSTKLPLKTRGSIVNVGSMASHLAINNLGPYIMSKHAVLGLCKSDALDYAKEGIRINCICPGWIKTGINAMLHDNALGDQFIARAPMNRWGFPEEVAYTVSFLLSDKASFITGSSVEISGGYSAC